MTPDRLQVVVERFLAACQVDPRVVAAFIGGSLATGAADQYSDLDLYLIVADEAYDSFFAERVAFMRRLGAPVYLDDFDGFGFDMVLFIFEDGVQGELGLAKAGRFLHIHGGPFRVLADKANLLQGVTFPPDRVPPEEQRANLEQAIRRFWRNLYLLAIALGRHRLLTAAEYFEDVRRRLMQVCRLSADFTDAGGHPPSEKLLSEPLAVAYGRTFFPLERGAMIAAAQEAVRLFQQVARPLAQTHGIDYPEVLERVVLRQFDEVIRRIEGQT